MSSSARLRLAALVVFLGIALGAFGAHGLADRLEATGRIGNWQTATLYHLLHGLALFVIALHSPKALGYWWFLTGILLFALTDFTKLGAITPLGGLAFLIGWGRWIFHRSSPVTPS